MAAGMLSPCRAAAAPQDDVLVGIDAAGRHPRTAAGNWGRNGKVMRRSGFAPLLRRRTTLTVPCAVASDRTIALDSRPMIVHAAPARPWMALPLRPRLRGARDRHLDVAKAEAGGDRDRRQQMPRRRTAVLSLSRTFDQTPPAPGYVEPSARAKTLVDGERSGLRHRPANETYAKRSGHFKAPKRSGSTARSRRFSFSRALRSSAAATIGSSSSAPSTSSDSLGAVDHLAVFECGFWRDRLMLQLCNALKAGDAESEDRLDPLFFSHRRYRRRRRHRRRPGSRAASPLVDEATKLGGAPAG